MAGDERRGGGEAQPALAAGGGDLLALRRVRQRGGHGDRHQGLLPAHRAPPHLARHHLHLLRRHAQVLPPLQALLIPDPALVMVWWYYRIERLLPRLARCSDELAICCS